MRLLAVVSKLTGVSTTVESSAVTLNAPSIVKYQWPGRKLVNLRALIRIWW